MGPVLVRVSGLGATPRGQARGKSELLQVCPKQQSRMSNSKSHASEHTYNMRPHERTHMTNADADRWGERVTRVKQNEHLHIKRTQPSIRTACDHTRARTWQRSMRVVGARG